MMLPDQELGAKIESDERQRLDSIRAQLSQEQVCVSVCVWGGGMLQWLLCWPVVTVALLGASCARKVPCTQ